MTAFASMEEARLFLSGEIDRPSHVAHSDLPDGIALDMQSYELGGGSFTNSYDIQYEANTHQARVLVHEELQSVASSLKDEHKVAISGGFFFLADRASAQPRQKALNLAISDGTIRSLPVVDRETLLCRDGRLSVRQLRAIGNLTLNGTELTWAGSLTDHEADCRVYANANAVVTHEFSARNGSERVLHEASRYTPPIMNDGTVDLGVRYDAHSGAFSSLQASERGRVDIFDHDFVLRVPARYCSLQESNSAVIRSVDTEIIDSELQGALSVGPLLSEADYTAHPINHDLSLGAKPPFTNRRMARLVLYMTQDNTTHLRLFDGRPDSSCFAGVTPTEAAQIVQAESAVRWGCFLDPGQTAKMYVQDAANGVRMNFGNRHYLQWPMHEDEPYTWVPDTGRPVASAIVLS